MKYFPSDHLDAIALREPRLQPIDCLEACAPGEILLIEESQLARLGRVDFLIDLIVLTEGREPYHSPDPRFRVHRSIYKYFPLSRLRAELFSDRHRITWYTSTISNDAIATLCEDLTTESSFHDFRLVDRKSDSLLNPRFESGKYRWIDSAIDLLDPPIETVRQLLLRFAQEGSVGILSMPMKGELDRLFASLADEVVVFVREQDLATLEALFSPKVQVVTVVMGYSPKQISWRRTEDVDAVKRRICERRNPL